MTEIEYITAKLGTLEILCQLAEEASELSQAALKLRRAITGTNPTPVSADDAKHALNEEIVDIAVATEAWFESEVGGIDGVETDDIKSALGTFADVKIARWAGRLRAAANTNREPVTSTIAPTDAPTDTPTAGVKTRQEKFLEMFPRADVHTGVLAVCPGDIDMRFTCHGPKDCADCKKEYWLAAAKERKS